MRMLNDQDRALALLTARWLAQGRWLVGWSFLMTACAGVLLYQGSMRALAGGTVGVVLGGYAMYAGIRVSLDAALFNDLAQGRLDMAALDAALTVQGRQVAQGGRGMAERCRGARGWWGCLVAGVGLQTFWVLICFWWVAR